MNAKTDLTGQLAQAREAMQVMIANGSSADTRQRQERLINNLKAKIANS